MLLCFVDIKLDEKLYFFSLSWDHDSAKIDQKNVPIGNNKNGTVIDLTLITMSLLLLMISKLQTTRAVLQSKSLLPALLWGIILDNVLRCCKAHIASCKQCSTILAPLHCCVYIQHLPPVTESRDLNRGHPDNNQNCDWLQDFWPLIHPAKGSFKLNLKSPTFVATS